MKNSLSKRESQIMRLVAKGETDKGCAGILKISFHTVGSHKRRIFSKLGATCRAQAVAIFVRQSASR